MALNPEVTSLGIGSKGLKCNRDSAAEIVLQPHASFAVTDFDHPTATATDKNSSSLNTSAQTCSLLPAIVLETSLAFILELQTIQAYAAVHRDFAAAFLKPHTWSNVVLDVRGLQVPFMKQACIGELWK